MSVFDEERYWADMALPGTITDKAITLLCVLVFVTIAMVFIGPYTIAETLYSRARAKNE